MGGRVGQEHVPYSHEGSKMGARRLIVSFVSRPPTLEKWCGRCGISLTQLHIGSQRKTVARSRVEGGT